MRNRGGTWAAWRAFAQYGRRAAAARASSAALSALLLVTGHAHGNAAQQAIVDAGINLGWAVSRTNDFPVGDPIQTPAIDGALANAIAAITVAEGLFFEPYLSARAQSGSGAAVIAMLADYGGRFAGQMNPVPRAHYLHQAYLNYKDSLSVQWDSIRGYQRGPTCDSYFFEVAYHLARAQIASALGPAGINGERAELQSLKAAIYNGLHTGIDGYPWSSGNLVRSDNPGDRRLCCSFGPPPIWDPLQAMQAGTIGPAGYTGYRVTLRANALRAVTRHAYCRAGDTNQSINMAQMAGQGQRPPGGSAPRPVPPVAPVPPAPPPRNVLCNTAQKAGGDHPETIDVTVGATRGNVTFHYDVMNIKDRIVVSYAGRVLHDTGCISGKNVVGLWLDGAATTVRVQVLPNCAGQKGTQWNFRLVCPQ